MKFITRPLPAASLAGCIALIGALATPADATLLVYEPFDYPDAALNGQGGALGTTGTWTTNDTGFAAGWWCHPEGVLTGQFDDIGGGPNMFDGTVDNLPTAGGFVGVAGPEEQGLASGTRAPTGNMDANIGLAPSVTATFQSGTTTWFSYVGAHADNRNQGSPTFMLCTDPTENGQRGLRMQNSGNGIGGVGGPTRFNLHDVYPHHFTGGVHHQTPGGYLGGVFGGHDGIVSSFCSTPTCDGVLDESGQPRTQTMAWQISDANGFGAPNIIVGKIEWDADAGGEDIVSVVRFLETEALTEAAFDALVAATPALSSANWPDNKPDLDQSQFDLINISSLKFYVDEIRVGTTFPDVVSGPPEIPLQLKVTRAGPDLTIEWESEPGMLYNLRSETDPSNGEPKDWPIYDGNMDVAATPPTNALTIPLPADPARYFVIEEFPAPPVTVFSDDFEGGQGGWTTGSDGAAGTAWQIGTPSNVGPLTTNSGANCFGTNLDSDYAINADVWLRSPAIDLTGATAATLNYAEFKDIETMFDSGTINVLDAADNSLLAEIESGIEGTSTQWDPVTQQLPAEALGKMIKIEFRLNSDEFGVFAGWYIDDVAVTTPAP